MKKLFIMLFILLPSILLATSCNKTKTQESVASKYKIRQNYFVMASKNHTEANAVVYFVDKQKVISFPQKVEFNGEIMTEGEVNPAISPGLSIGDENRVKPNKDSNKDGFVSSTEKFQVTNQFSFYDLESKKSFFDFDFQPVEFKPNENCIFKRSALNKIELVKNALDTNSEKDLTISQKGVSFSFKNNEINFDRENNSLIIPLEISRKLKIGELWVLLYSSKVKMINEEFSTDSLTVIYEAKIDCKVVN